jgi:hypothetical protein
VSAAEPVPPFTTGNTPVTLLVKSIVPFVISPLTMSEEESSPEELLWTTPAELNALTVGAWATVRLVIVEVASVDVPVTDNVPPTVKRLLMVVEPVTVKVLPPTKVKLVEVPITLVPWPNNISLAVKFCREMFGVLPPVEVMEPLPVTEVTVPAKVVVAIIFPFASTAKTEDVRPLPKDSWEMVVVASVDVPVTPRVPPTVNRLEIVVLPVIAKVLEVGLNVKLLDPAVEDAAVAYKIWLADKDPLSLLLNVAQSVDSNWPVLLMLANGRFIVREFVVVEMLKMLPLVPVATLVMTLFPKVIWVEVPMRTFCPPAMDRPEPTVKLPSVVVPMPPTDTVKTPEVIWLALIAMEVFVTAVTRPWASVVNTGTWLAEP